MRVLLFSDLHGHAFKPYSTILPDGMNSRLRDALLVLEQIRKLAKQEKVDLILFGGDLFHVRGSLYVQTFNAIFEAMARLKLTAQLGLLVGNHDQTNKAGSIHSVYAFNTMATVMDKPMWYTFETVVSNTTDRLHVLALPYTTDSNDIRSAVDEGVQSKPQDPKGCPHIILGHMGVDGARVGGGFVLRDKDAPKLKDLKRQEFAQVFLGHYHVPQILADNVRFIGSTLQHNWGDLGTEHGCWLWDTQPGDPYDDPQFRPLKAPEFKHWKYSSLESGKVKRGETEGNYVRVLCKVHPNMADRQKMEERLLNMGAAAVEFLVLEPERAKSNAPATLQVGMDMMDMIAQYVWHHCPSDMEEYALIEAGKDLLP